ncbi:hypothetical protein B0H11DRAFT_2103736 [Mycena galericulata]|nr:hypothetical protein B0H11DRAFT_2103736 [Mycena galericulata]
MTEYDASPEAYNQYRRTQVRIAHWVDDTVHSAPHFKSPFLPRSDVQDNEFYNPRSGSPHRHTPSPSHSQSSSHGHGRRAPQRSHSQGYGYNPPPAQPQFRSPLRAQTISVVSPNDSISQASGPTQSHRRRSLHRSHSSSPTRHSSSHRSHRHSSGGAYVVSGSPQYGQYNSGQYVQPPQQIQYASQQQPAAYIVHPRDRKVQIVVRPYVLTLAYFTPYLSIRSRTVPRPDTPRAVPAGSVPCAGTPRVAAAAHFWQPKREA